MGDSITISKAIVSQFNRLFRRLFLFYKTCNLFYFIKTKPITIYIAALVIL